MPPPKFSKPHHVLRKAPKKVQRPRLPPVDLWCELPTDVITHILGFLAVIPSPTPPPPTASSLASLSHLGTALQTLNRVCRAWHCSIKSTLDDWLYGRMFCARFHLVKATCKPSLQGGVPQATVRCTCSTPLSNHNWGALLISRLTALKALEALGKREAIQRMQRLSVKNFSSLALKRKSNVVCDVCTCCAVLKAKDLAVHMRVHHKLAVLRRSKAPKG